MLLSKAPVARAAIRALSLIVGLLACVATTAGQGFSLVPPTSFVRDASISEDVQAVVQRSLADTLVAGLLSRDWQRVEKALASDFQGRFPRPESGSRLDDPLLRVRAYEQAELPQGDASFVVAALNAHLEPWVAVERASWHTFEFLLHPAQTVAFVRAHFQLGGADAAGSRTVLEMSVAAEVVTDDGETWQLRRLDVESGHRVSNPLPPFREITDPVGLHLNRSVSNEQLRQDVADTGMSLIDSALGIVDWNRDGFWDVLVTEAASYGVVFVNDGKGGFVREELPFRSQTLVPGQALYLDLDGDGQEELVGSRVVYQDDRAWMAIHTRPEGVWVEKPRALEFDNPPGLRRNETQLITAADVNGDGLTDLFVGGYQNSRSGQPGRFNRVDATDGDDNLLFINRGNLRFTEESDTRGITGTRYTYVAEFFDFDGDGDLDLFEGNDFGPNALWANTGSGQFQSAIGHPLARQSANTMGITIGDWDNTGLWSVYLSNMYSHAGNRVVRLVDSVSRQTQEQLAVLARGNQLFEQTGGSAGDWSDRAVMWGANDGGWAWASIFYDIDNDGDKEIFVTNGNASHRDRAAPDF